MNKNLFWLIALSFALSFGFTSCAEDTTVEDPYANWEVRNDRYLDSIADVARTHPGEWEIYRNYKIANGSTTPGLGGNSVSTNPSETPPSANDSVYMKILEPGTGITPLFTDSVSVYYRGKLINGTVFDQNYTGDLNPEVHVPTHFALQASQTSGGDGLIVGWITALQHMKEGQRVELYIPADLAYGSTDRSSIPANSMLIFDLKLEKVIHPKGIENYSLKRK
ncbi:FKBP-type peptidyl-prolyl cis-trans isomerase [Bacteroides mediterraneensis]|uniref:FKBP-type peptidyl-prolyl cis-trans isomerase n=1 Tax=Bacteroides mediterraneensis TaxID=1841856 RepID=UPI0026EF1D5E|nr:FKBP-type peptidyl-prolyl cis-trans isomerase [Bacteroides mediterraneensis]